MSINNERARDRFRRFLEKRFSLRVHMFLILAGVFCAGLLSSKILLLLHIRSMLIRYPLAVICSYIAFFGLVKLWLVYLASPTGKRNSLSARKSGIRDSSLPDFSLNLSGGPDAGGPSFSGGGGGSFGGGGVSASFDDGPGVPFPSMAAASSDLSSDLSSDSGGGLAEGVADGAGKAVSGIFDSDDAGWVLIVLGILLAIVFGAGIYLIYQAPVILSDAAFQAILSAGLARSMKKMSDPDWMKGILRTTAVPFLIILSMSVAAAWVMYHAYPDAYKMSEVLRRLF